MCTLLSSSRFQYSNRAYDTPLLLHLLMQVEMICTSTMPFPPFYRWEYQEVSISNTAQVPVPRF